jgi:hypothetical protein
LAGGVKRSIVNKRGAAANLNCPMFALLEVRKNVIFLVKMTKLVVSVKAT